MPAEPLQDTLVRAQEVALRDVAPHAEAVDANATWPRGQLLALRRAGLGGLVIPEARGGLGHGLYGLLRVTELLGTQCASTAMCFGMHCVGSAVVSAKATPEQQADFLEPIVAGRHLTTLALSEPGSGAHFYLPQTEITMRDETFLLNGTKSFVTNGGHADSYVLNGVAESNPETPGVFSCLVLRSDAPGISWKDEWRGTGMRGNSSRVMRLDDAPVPRAHLLGEQGENVWYVFNVIAPYFLVAMSGTYLGVAQAAFDAATEHLRGRRHAHTRSSLAQNPVLQHRLGRLWADLEKARRLCQYAAEQSDANGPDAMPALLSAKAEAAETAVHAASEAMALMGGLGYAEGGRADRHLRDALAGPIMAPTTDMLRTWTGRWLLGEPLLSG